MFFIKDKERKDAKINPKSSKEQTCTPKGITVPHTPAKMLWCVKECIYKPALRWCASLGVQQIYHD